MIRGVWSMGNDELMRWAIGIVAIPTVSFVVWLVRLEGRVNSHDESLKSFREDLHYVRNRIDEALHK